MPVDLRVSDLAKTYPDGARALQGISIDVRGGVLGVLGENGAGKSTAFSILALSLQATSGQVLYDGLDGGSSRNHREIRRRIGLLPQTFQPSPLLSGWEFLHYCARMREVQASRSELRTRIGDLLDAAGLLEAASRPTKQYSGGMRRRLGVCQAFVHDPGLVILDEPSAGLDPEQRILLRHFVREMSSKHTILLSSHVVDDIEQTCEAMAVISKGCLLYSGTPFELQAKMAPCLWEVQGTETDLLQRHGEAGHVVGLVAARGTQIVFSERPLANGLRREPTLEEAYGALLARDRARRTSPEGAMA